MFATISRISQTSSNILQLRFLVILFFGFSSGLPLLLTSSTLQAWYTVDGINLIAIGALSLIGMPYLWKFLWAQFLDNYTPKFLGRRRGWLLGIQIALTISLACLAVTTPKTHPQFIAIIALIATFFSASQDIAINAYITEILEPEQRGLGAAVYVTGYRIAMIISGGVALIMAQYMNWQWVYLIMAGFMVIGIFSTLIAKEPYRQDYVTNSNLRTMLIEPFREFLSRDNAWLILLFIVIYKLSDALIQTMTPTFLLRDLGFTLVQVGTINKGLGLGATIVGVFIGGWLTPRLGMFRGLILFGILQALGNLLYMLLAMVGKDYSLMVIAITVENLFAGMAMATFIAFIMSLCNQRYTATQFALLSALAAIGRVCIGPLAGATIVYLGWVNFYLISFLIAIPALILLVKIGRVD